MVGFKSHEESTLYNPIRCPFCSAFLYIYKTISHSYPIPNIILEMSDWFDDFDAGIILDFKCSYGPTYSFLSLIGLFHDIYLTTYR
jgi:hypothetical protein